MTGILGELMGRECGLLRGSGGSMHLMDVAKGAMGSYAIIGAHMPIAAGAAWWAQYRKSGQVAVCFFGDGTTNIGAFDEPHVPFGGTKHSGFGREGTEEDIEAMTEWKWETIQL